ncbi:hypothetical protein [Kiloniella sp.]|uniref:hypothetical protein n=1 Tax=Kiloniella sp. TaxID=1938587 RepID=UPI003B010FE6
MGDAVAGPIRDTIEDRGYLRCGIEKIEPFLGFKNPLESAAREYCQALTVALFQDRKALKIIPIPNGKKHDYINNGKVDLVMLAGRDRFDKSQKSILSAPLLINGVRVLKPNGEKNFIRLSGNRICTLNNKVNKSGLAVLGQKQQISFSVISYETPEQLLEMTLKHNCKAIALPRVNLRQFKQKILSKFPQAHILRESSTKDSLGILVSTSDKEWVNITSSFGHVLLEAEIGNISSKNIDIIASTTTNEAVQKLLGLKGDLGLSLGLDRQWAYRVIKTHGNYKEIYQRHFGENSAFPIPRDPIEQLIGD